MDEFLSKTAEAPTDDHPDIDKVLELVSRAL